jgi:uncharacterized membrane protein
MKKMFHRTHDPIWHLQLGVVAVIGLQLVTAHSFLPANKIILITLELALLFGLTVLTPNGYHRISQARRTLALALIGVVTAANIFSLIILLNSLITGDSLLSGEELLLNAVTIYTTNIFLFALWYWEMDGGGPDGRTQNLKRRDFLFPQMIHKYVAPDDWRPGFTDYLYLSSTNVANFASADTLPISHRAKVMMMVQSLVSVVTVVLVAARAISLMQ